MPALARGQGICDFDIGQKNSQKTGKSWHGGSKTIISQTGQLELSVLFRVARTSHFFSEFFWPINYLNHIVPVLLLVQAHEMSKSLYLPKYTRSLFKDVIYCDDLIKFSHLIGWLRQINDHFFELV